jgi:hypothetical protein
LTWDRAGGAPVAVGEGVTEASLQPGGELLLAQPLAQAGRSAGATMDLGLTWSQVTSGRNTHRIDIPASDLGWCDPANQDRGCAAPVATRIRQRGRASPYAALDG